MTCASETPWMTSTTLWVIVVAGVIFMGPLLLALVLRPPFMCTRLHKEALSALAHGNDYGYDRRKRKITKHVTFATPLFKVCNDELPTLYDDSNFLFLGNASTPGQSIYSYAV